MPVSHAPVPACAPDAVTGHDGVPGLLEMLAQVADPRRKRRRRFTLAFTLAVAVVCVLAGARSFRVIGDQAADLPQEMLAALGGVPCPLRRRVLVPSEKRIRTLLQSLDGAALDIAAAARSTRSTPTRQSPGRCSSTHPTPRRSPPNTPARRDLEPTRADRASAPDSPPPAAAQPTTAREKMSATNATYTVPASVGTG